MATLLLILKSLLPLIEPVVAQEFSSVLIPWLQGMVAADITSPDLKLIASDLLAALQAIGTAEIAKI